MADFDPENIPVLDDIIEDEDDDAIKDRESAEPQESDDNTPNLFAETPAQTEDSLSEEEIVDVRVFTDDESSSDFSAIEEETGISENAVYPVAADTAENETADDIEAETTFPVDGSADSPVDTLPADGPAVDTPVEESTEAPSAIAESPEPVTGLPNEETVTAQTLDNMVSDIVKQLMPDLEQQLRFLVQQALEDRLPEDVVSQLKNETGQ